MRTRAYSGSCRDQRVFICADPAEPQYRLRWGYESHEERQSDEQEPYESWEYWEELLDHIPDAGEARSIIEAGGGLTKQDLPWEEYVRQLSDTGNL